MTKFEPAERGALNVTVQQLVDASGISQEAAEMAIRAMEQDKGKYFLNDLYQVVVRDDNPDIVYLSVKRIDKQPIHDWRHLQQIKNELVGEENEGLELYPAESRKVDSANQYHLWVLKDPKARISIGFTEGRLVTEKSAGASVQRPFEE